MAKVPLEGGERETVEGVEGNQPAKEAPIGSSTDMRGGRLWVSGAAQDAGPPSAAPGLGRDRHTIPYNRTCASAPACLSPQLLKPRCLS